MGNQPIGPASPDPQAGFVGACLAAPCDCGRVDVRKNRNGPARFRHRLEGHRWTVRGGVCLSRARAWCPYSLVRLANLVGLHLAGSVLWRCSFRPRTRLGQHRWHRGHHRLRWSSFRLALRAMALQPLACNPFARRSKFGLAGFRTWRECAGWLARKYPSLGRHRYFGRSHVLASAGAQA